jgi:hypothetical protein
MIAIHHFDNAVELLLKCVATRFNIAFKSQFVTFPQLWEAVNQKTLLPKKTEIFQLHDFRSDVQHWGVSPFSSEIVDRFDVYVLDFIREVLVEVFGLDFDELFMSSLVEDKNLRRILSVAETAFEKGDYVKCMRYADAAFSKAFWCKREEFRLWVPSVKEEFLEELADIVSIMILGIDYMSFHKHQQVSTGAIWDEEKKTIRYPLPLEEALGDKEYEPDTKWYSRENAFFSLNFALNCILHWHF